MASLDDILNAHLAGQANPATQVNAAYAATPIGQIKTANKLAEIRDAASIKRQKLSDFRAAIAGQTEAFQQQEQANANSWVGQAGLDPDSALGTVVNAAANVVAGGSRQIVGAMASLPHTFIAGMNDASLSQDETNAYNNYVQGKATPEEVALLNVKKTTVGAGGMQTSMTPMENAAQGDATRKIARGINDFFDIDSIIHQGSKNKLNAQLGESFEGDSAKVSAGWDSIKSGEYGDGAKEMASGLAGLLINAGEAAIDNPKAVAEYVAQNAPQLAIGAFGTLGRVSMASSNAGYAADYYQKGMEKFSKDNGGQLPSVQERAEIAGWAASLAVAEQVGDMVGLGVMKPGTKTGAIEGFKNALKAATQGTMSEAVTEGYQTFAEGQAQGEATSASDIYKGAVIGGLTGGVMSGGVRALAEVAGATPEQATERVQKANDTAIFNEAVEKNDPSIYMTEGQPQYDPAKAVGVLMQHNLKEDTTPEVRISNFTKANEIMDGLNERLDAVKEQLKSDDPAVVNAAHEEREMLVAQINEGQPRWDRMYTELTKAFGGEDTGSDTEQTINLSMASTGSLSVEKAQAMAEDTSNDLNEDQRGFLRAFSEARLAYNAAQDMGKVTKTVLEGNGIDLGIKQYRNRIGMALAANNDVKATADLDLLTKFATSHTEKAAAAKAGFEEYGEEGQVYKTKNGWGYAAPGTYKTAELLKGGGLPVLKERLVKALQAEAKALAATRDEMTQAVKVKFSPTQKAKAPVASKTPTPAPTATQPVTPDSPSVEQKNTAPSEKVITPPHGKEEARLSSPTPEPVVSTPQNDNKSSNKLKEKVVEYAEYLRNPPDDYTTAKAEAIVKWAKVQQDRVTKALASEEEFSERHTELSDLRDELGLMAKTGDTIVSADKEFSAATEPQSLAPSPVSSSPSSVADAPSSVTDTAALAEPTPAIEALTEKAGKDVKYVQKKLGDLYSQAEVALSRVKNLVSSIKKPDDVLDIVGVDKLTTEQSVAIRTFTEVAKSWEDTIKSNLDVRNKPDYNYEDSMQYFIRPDGDIEENVKTALSYAAFSYVAENFGRTSRNTNAEVNALLGRDRDTRVTPDERALLQDTLVSMPALIDSLGQRVVKALGLKANASTPVNELARTQAGLGAHALRLLIDGDTPLLNLKYVDPKVINAMRGKAKTFADVSGLDAELTSGFQQEVFLDINRDEERKPVALATKIVEANKGSGSIINKLFAAEDVERPPTFEPVTKLRPFAKRTQQVVPEYLNKIIRKLNAQPNYIRQDKLELLSVVGDDRFLSMMGVKPNTKAVHAAKRDALDAKNEGLRRELDGIKEFVKSNLKGELDTPFFFEHYAMKQQRVGIDNSLVNPQMSKIHRFMVYRDSWKTTVQMNDIENFLLRVAEGMGVKTDKTDKVSALRQVNQKIASPEVQAGIAAIIKMETGDVLSDAEKDAIVTAANTGGENAHSLDALVALAQYTKAEQSSATSFDVNMLAEVDGVTNGPMLSHLLMGAAASVDDLYKMLNRGGFYTTEGMQFNDWRAAAGNEDLYETTTRNSLSTLASMVAQGEIDNVLLSHVMNFMGKLEDKETGKIEKAGRNMIKTPLTAVVYGSGIKTAIEGMAADFISNIYSSIEATAKSNDEATHRKNVKAIRAMGIDLDSKTTIKELMELQFTTAEENMLVSQFMETMGKAVDATIRTDFKHLLDNRQKFNATASITFDMYNAAYTAERAKLIEELIASGEIAADGALNPIHDLTKAQEKILNERIAAVTPVLQTAMSNLSGAPTSNSGMLVASSEMQPAKSLPYKAVVRYAKGFKTINGKTAKSLTAYGRNKVNTDPGVVLGATSTHSFDSAVSHSAIAGNEIINLHDAHGTGAHSLIAAGERLNKAVWDRGMEYSPAQEMYETYMRSIRGMSELLKTGTDSMKAQLASSLIAQSAKSSVWNPETKRRTTPIPAETILMVRGIEAKRLAFEADSIKFGAMAQMQSIAQYAVEGGNYNVKETDRAAAQAKLDALTAQMPDADLTVVQQVQDQLKDYIEAATLDATEQAKAQGPTKREKRVSDFGTVGKPVVTSDVAISNWMRKNPNASVAQLAGFMRTQKLDDFQTKLLASLVRALGDRATNYRVRLISKDSAVSDVLERPMGAAHAWFVSKDGKNEMYFLSPDFKESGITIESVLHELTHAAVAHAIANPTAETKPLIDELEVIRVQAAQIIEDGKIDALKPAVESVQELVAYGMTNPAFQGVLASMKHNTGNAENKWVSGLKAFIDTLVKLVFKRDSDVAANGLTSLITNVSGLMAASANSRASRGYINQSMAAQPSLASLNGEEMYDALGQLGTTRLDPAFDASLRNTLNKMELSVHFPLAAMKQAVQASAAQSPTELWRDMKDANVAMFAKNALSSGFNFTEQEAFALEQVEATIRVALATKDGSTSALYRELATLYRDARNELKSKIATFHPNAKQAQALYDFVFKMEPAMGDQSDYLSRFAALGLVNHEFAKLLEFDTPVSNSNLTGMPFGEKLHILFERFLEWINQRATNTFKGQKADEKLNALVDQLVHIEQRKRMKLAQSVGVATDAFEGMFRSGAETIRKTAELVGQSDFFKNSTNGVIRLTGKITTLVANDRVDQYLDVVQKFRDQASKDRQGLLMGIVNETRGSTAANAIFHKLLRISKHNEGIRKDLITNTTTFVMNSFADGGKYLGDQAKKAISYGIMRTDVVALLPHFDIDGIRALFDNKAELNNAIAKFEAELTGLGSQHTMSYLNGAKALGLYLATGEVGAENLRLNAENIAGMLGTDQAGKVNQSDIDAATAVLDPLVSLYAISMLHKSHVEALKAVFAEEGKRPKGQNGIEAVLKLHKDLQQQSKDRLFQAAGALRMKGYTPEIYNPYIRLEVASAKDSAKLEERGFSIGHKLQMDDADPTKTNDMHIYSLRDGGMVQYLTGVFSYTGSRKRGTATHNGDLGLLSATGMMNRKKMNIIEAQQQRGVATQARRPIDPVKDAFNKNFLVPVFNGQGDLVNYRYMMSHAAKDSLLERDNSFEQILGVMAGNIFDKETTKAHNETAVQALYDQYKGDFAQNAASYLEIGPNSTDKESREVWRLLPEATKESVRNIWGGNSMMVRFDILDMNFGYRKLSAASAFGVPEAERDMFQKVYVEIMEAVLGKKAELYIRRAEEGWQSVIGEIKDTLVVKSGVTLLGNFTSNVSQLIWFGVPLTDIWKHHRVALKGVTAYRRDSKRLAQLEMAIQLDSLQGRDRKEAERDIIQLKDALARNPVRELVEAGLMPTIVEDVSQEDDKFSYKGQMTKKIDEFVGNLNPVVLKAGKYLVMAQDTPLYQGLAYATQVSDFLARYTLHQHVQNRAKMPLTGDKAIQLVSDAFVNYDVPSHRTLQYANDMGLVYFTKYYLRIQKVIAMLYQQNPGRAMMLLTVGHFMDFLPMLTHSAMLGRIGNPFSMGAFEAFGAVEELLTVKTLMTPFHD
jgi:hypothetical protein